MVGSDRIIVEWIDTDWKCVHVENIHIFETNFHMKLQTNMCEKLRCPTFIIDLFLFIDGNTKESENRGKCESIFDFGNLTTDFKKIVQPVPKT